jgi:hypothetical protein
MPRTDIGFSKGQPRYLLITNAFTPTAELPRGLWATLAQRDNRKNINIISHSSRQMKENEKNYTPFLLETAAAVWGMDNFNKYLKGSRFKFYTDPTPASDLGTTKLKLGTD